MRRFMGDQARTAQQLRGRGRLLEKKPRCVVLDGARVLHPTVRVCGDQCETELGIGVGDAGVVFEPVERRGMQVEDLIDVPRNFVLVGFAVQHGHFPAFDVPLNGLESSGDEGE